MSNCHPLCQALNLRVQPEALGSGYMLPLIKVSETDHGEYQHHVLCLGLSFCFLQKSEVLDIVSFLLGYSRHQPRTDMFCH